MAEKQANKTSIMDAVVVIKSESESAGFGYADGNTSNNQANSHDSTDTSVDADETERSLSLPYPRIPFLHKKTKYRKLDEQTAKDLEKNVTGNSDEVNTNANSDYRQTESEQVEMYIVNHIQEEMTKNRTDDIQAVPQASRINDKISRNRFGRIPAMLHANQFQDVKKCTFEGTSGIPETIRESHYERNNTVLSIKSKLVEESDAWKPYICSLCGKCYSLNSNLTVHMRKHTGERPHVCSTCGANFNRKCDLHRHIKIHTGQKEYVCTECGKEFLQRCHLLDHIRLHNRGRPNPFLIKSKISADSQSTNNILPNHSNNISNNDKSIEKSILVSHHTIA